MKTLLFLALTSFVSALEPIILWPSGAPGSEGKDTPEKVEVSANGEQTVTNIHRPSITPFLPSKETANGAAVIIAPGGGHKLLCTTHEGSNVAEWLADHGVAAFVLKYRLASEPGSTYTVDEHAVVDMHRAIRLVRSKAEAWNINPDAVGVMGFSAGGEVCSICCMNASVGKPEAADLLDRFSSKPDFQALIYPGRSHRIVPTKDSPSAFLAASSNDRPDISEGLTKVYLDFKRAGAPVELHLYADGGHGFGLRAGKIGPVYAWIDRFQEWLVDKKFTRR
jgi:acetyl esterase/lipase